MNCAKSLPLNDIVISLVDCFCALTTNPKPTISATYLTAMLLKYTKPKTKKNESKAEMKVVTKSLVFPSVRHL